MPDSTDFEIGTFEFVALKGNWIPPAEQIQVDERPGVDGTEAVKRGRKGRPFPIVSQVDAANINAAYSLFQQYQGLIDGDAVEMTLNSVDSGTLDFKVLVLDVQPLQIRAMRGAVGYVKNPPSLAWLECAWTLLAVPVEEETP